MSRLTILLEQAQERFTPGVYTAFEEGQGVLYMDERHDKFLDYLDDANIPEALKRVRVVRKGRRVIKFKSDKPGFKVVFVNGRPKEVKIAPAELMKRKRSAKRGARKAKAKRGIALQRRKKSLRLMRRWIDLRGTLRRPRHEARSLQPRSTGRIFRKERLNRQAKNCCAAHPRRAARE